MTSRTSNPDPKRLASSYRPLAYGFTLIELMAVVAIIGITAAIAVPGVTARMRDRRVAEAAQRIADIYADARMHALGRGSAVLVRFASGEFSVREAQRGLLELNPDCAALPVSSCTTTDWNNAVNQQFRSLSSLNLSNHGEYGTGSSKVVVTMQDDAGAAMTNFDLCFTPSGRAFTRTDFTQALSPVRAAMTAEVARSGFRTRRVLVLPNGAARVTL